MKTEDNLQHDFFKNPLNSAVLMGLTYFELLNNVKSSDSRPKKPFRQAI